MDYSGKESMSNNNKSNNANLLPIILLLASAAAIVAMIILPFFGVYFFFFFLPLTFSLPWSVKRLRDRKGRNQWNIEDLASKCKRVLSAKPEEREDPFIKISAI